MGQDGGHLAGLGPFAGSLPCQVQWPAVCKDWNPGAPVPRCPPAWANNRATSASGWLLQPRVSGFSQQAPMNCPVDHLAPKHSPDGRNARTQIHIPRYTLMSADLTRLFVIPFFSEQRGLIEGLRRWLRRLKYIVGNLPASCFCIVRTLYTAPRYIPHTSGSKRSAVFLSSESHGVFF